MVTKQMLEMKQHLVAERKKEVFSLSRQIQSLNYPPSPLYLPLPSISPGNREEAGEVKDVKEGQTQEGDHGCKGIEPIGGEPLVEDDFMSTYFSGH